MSRHLVTLSPDRDILIVAVSGVRTPEAAHSAISEAIELRASSGIDHILFDTVGAELQIPPEALMSRALSCGQALARSRIAILATDEDSTYARVWRKGLADSGHEAIVFTDAAAASAWLASAMDTDALHLA